MYKALASVKWSVFIQINKGHLTEDALRGALTEINFVPRDVKVFQEKRIAFIDCDTFDEMRQIAKIGSIVTPTLNLTLQRAINPRALKLKLQRFPFPPWEEFVLEMLKEKRITCLGVDIPKFKNSNVPCNFAFVIFDNADQMMAARPHSWKIHGAFIRFIDV
eukprot:TRINITY_DN376_c0_g1_i5.p1 TRINITY_DN376_c0_g1~~TRINITY_DN376_c0_g1_i5.p1  ORF type:complete len:162 (+),score=23.27 TRINITY_DN376_c0_g1_i5:531-1016(+)